MTGFTNIRQLHTNINTFNLIIQGIISHERVNHLFVIHNEIIAIHEHSLQTYT